MASRSPSPFPRRAFLARAGAGLVAAAVLPRGLAQGSRANSRIRLGLIGCGARGSVLLEQFLQHGGFEVAGLADYFPARVEAAAARARLGGAQTFVGLQSAEKLLAKGGLDAVVVATPPYFHPAQTRLAVNAGLHVFLVAPVAVDVPGCHSVRESEAIARRRKRVVLVDFQARADAFYREAIRRVHAGALGDLCFGEATSHGGGRGAGPKPASAEARLQNWFADQALSGDSIVAQHVVALDVMNWLMKDTPPLRCTGTGGRRSSPESGDAWDHYALLYEYASDVGFTFSARQFAAFGEAEGTGNRLFGTRGVFSGRWGGPVALRGEGAATYRGGATVDLDRTGSIANIRTFHQLVLQGDGTDSTVAPAVTSTLVAIMGRLAARQKTTLSWADVMASKQILHPNLAGLHT